MILLDFAKARSQALWRALKARAGAAAVRLAKPFHHRPALKRSLRALVLQQSVLLPLLAPFGAPQPVMVAFFAFLLAVFWTGFLLGLFWGLAAERASMEWESVFALPTLKSFAPWRWHALERKRFLAVAVSLLSGLFAALSLGGL